MRARSFLTALALVFVLGVVSTPVADGQDYRYFDREDLFREREKWVGTGAVVTDVLMKVWEHQEVKGYLKFETRYFRCAVKADSEAAEMIKQLAEQLDDGGKGKRLVTVWGLVDRPEFWGEVSNQDEGVDTETIWIVADNVTKPREHHFLDIDLDEDW